MSQLGLRRIAVQSNSTALHFLAAAPKRTVISLLPRAEFSYFRLLPGASGYNQGGLQPAKKRSLSYPARAFAIESSLFVELRGKTPSIEARILQPDATHSTKNPPTKSDVSRWLTEKGNP
jgi:hypothetical protein